jgi:glycosyltransferase involved in cell wall biosynthesis
LTGRADVLGVRIALVTDTYLPQVNGVTTVVRRIADTLRAAAYDIVVVAPRYPHGPGGDGGGVEELRVPSLPFPPYPSIRLSIPLYRHVEQFLDRFTPDLVHVATEGPLGVMATRARGTAEQRDSHDENRELLRQYAALVTPVSAASAVPYTASPISPEGVLDRC